MKQQILVIHGGDTFSSNKDYLNNLKSKPIDLDRFRQGPMWKNNLATDLGDEYDVILPNMPNANYAKYQEWKLWFERILPLLDKRLILVGHSMGGIFLAKYLSEHTLPKQIKALILVAAPYKDMPGEVLVSFNLSKSLRKLSKQTKNILLVQSLDDEVVEPKHVELFKNDLPTAQLMLFKDRGHFKIEHFPEIVEYIKTL